MARLSSYVLGAATLACALGTGYVMQYGFALPQSAAKAPDVQLEISAITPTSSATVVPLIPADRAPEAPLPVEPVVVKAAVEPDLPDTALPEAPEEAGFSCDLTMTATPAAGAMVDVLLTAPCRASERVTIHHQGMMFTEVMQPDGTLFLTVPALAEQAVFIASFAGGDGAMTSAGVSSLPFYDRVAVQWKGEAGLQLHAREFSAEYFSEGHIWAASAGNLTAAARGEGGFLTRLGRADAPDALVVEVYSFPAGTAQRSGEILLSVEAEVTDLNCATKVEAQTLEIREGGDLRTRDLAIEMPACDALGDFLVLKNLVEDLTIAGR
ncbi:translocase [Mameliella sediminis]|uniref:translocase n=1 Tax=Mameliella sediminis TaxID=2836866 RepID=UPI001C44D524|nr:translocase [Mameliella sediminis]MBY6113779.1 translocase [Antarctobacter heliothermus]MBY6142873.1 translocase [Mameliella alba]MBV7395076.1 translocase [Mameliella sediminis]MBY6159728.1 translocase [Mameliella alba]MBY6168199.1 translocase [Mameliella alba]